MQLLLLLAYYFRILFNRQAPTCVLFSNFFWLSIVHDGESSGMLH